MRAYFWTHFFFIGIFQFSNFVVQYIVFNFAALYINSEKDFNFVMVILKSIIQMKSTASYQTMLSQFPPREESMNEQNISHNKRKYDILIQLVILLHVILCHVYIECSVL